VGVAGRALRIRSAEFGHFSWLARAWNELKTMTTNRDKFLMRVKLHIFFCCLNFLVIFVFLLRQLFGLGIHSKIFLTSGGHVGIA